MHQDKKASCLCSRVFTKKLFFIFALILASSFLCANKANAATYYVRADGSVTCANKATATSPNAASTSLSYAQYFSCSYSAGDKILFSSQGGNYTSTINLSASGTGIGNEITYANVPGENPEIHVSSGTSISTFTKSNVIVDGFSIVYTGTTSTDNGIVIPAGTNITLKNINVNMGGYGYGMYSSSAISNLLIDNVTITNNTPANRSLFLYGTMSNITIQNSNISGGRGIEIWNATNITINNITATPGIRLKSVTTANIGTINAASAVPGGNYFSLAIYDSSGVTANDYTYSGTDYPLSIAGTSNNIVINRLSGSGAGVQGAWINDTANNITINDSSITGGLGFIVKSSAHDITFNRCSLLNTSGNGFVAQDNTYNITYNNCTADNGTDIGFVAMNSVSNITYNKCKSSNNGIVNTPNSNGGSFLPHDSATNINCYYCIAYNDYNQGFGDVSTGTNSIFNSTNWSNGYAIGDTYKGVAVSNPSIRGNIFFGKSGGLTTVKNIISGGNGKPREIQNNTLSQTILDYNLYNPLDDSNFISPGSGYTTWSSYHVAVEPHSNNSNPLFINASGNYSLATDFQPTYLSPSIDAGTTTPNMTATTTDFANNPIYGTPDMGAYEYQPPHTITSNTIDVGAGARIYADGKFRDLNTTNSNSAHLKITPQSGTFTTFGATATRPAWLDITNISNWTTIHKTWTESNAQTSNMITNHTVGDLEHNKYYTISITDALASNITGINGTTCITENNAISCLSDNNGNLSFEYNGGYSNHTFDLTLTTTAPETPIASPQAETYNKNQSVALSSIGSTSIRYSLTAIPDSCSSGTLYSNGNLIDILTSQTIYVRACNNFGNSTTATFAYIISPNTTGTTKEYRDKFLIVQKNLASQPNQVDSSPLSTNRTIKLTVPRMSGEDIINLQKYLNKYLSINLVSDGVYGTKTKEATIKFQIINNLTPDGAVGPKTWEKIK